MIGPSCTWFLRRLSLGFDAEPDGFELDVAECAAGARPGHRSGPQRTARPDDHPLLPVRADPAVRPRRLAVRRRLPPLARHHLARLPEALQDGARPLDGAQRRSAARPAAPPAAHRADDRGGTRPGGPRRGPPDVGGRGRTAGRWSSCVAAQDADVAQRSLIGWGAPPGLARAAVEWAGRLGCRPVRYDPSA